MTAAVFLGRFESGTPEWDQAREGRVGASDIGTIIGVSPFESRMQLLHRKAGLLADKKQTPAMERGDLLEPAVLAYLTRKHKVTIDPELNGTWADPDDPRLVATPDAVTTTGLLLEAKSTTDRSTDNGWGKAGTDLIPDHYLCQVQWCCGLLGLKEWRLGVISGAVNGRPNLSFQSYKGKADPELYAALRQHAVAFLTDLETLLTSKESAAA